MYTPKNFIPLEAFADELHEFIQAIREQEEQQQTALITDRRRLYTESCAQMGIKTAALAEIIDFSIAVGDSEVTLRLYRAHKLKPMEKTPLIFYIHGGGWVLGSLETHDSICRYLANHTACTVIAIDYRLAPEYQYPTALQDCIAALQYISHNATELGIDPEKIIVAGDSAGGQLSTIIAHQCHTKINGKIIAEVLFYPATDFTASSDSYQTITQGVPLTNKLMHWFIDLYIKPDDDRMDPQLSPLYFAAPRQSIRTLIITVGYDPLADEGIAYAQKLMKNGTHVEHLHLPDQTHSILTYTAISPTAERLLNRSALFIQSLI